MLAILMNDVIFHPLLLGGLLLVAWQLQQLKLMLRKALHPARR